MMNDVIHDETAKHSSTRHAHERLPASQKGPVGHEMLVGAVDDCGAGFLRTLVEGVEYFFARLWNEGLIGRRTRWLKIKLVLFERRGCPPGQFSEVTGKPSERHRLLMGFPVELVFGNSLKR